MKYEALEITDRIKRVRECYLNLPVSSLPKASDSKSFREFGTGDRWISLGYLRGWEKYADQPTVKLRGSYAEAEELYQSKPVIYDDELLLGHLYFPEYTKEEQAEYDRLCDSFVMSAYPLKTIMPLRKTHIGLDFEKLLTKGIDGIIADIMAKKEELDFFTDIYPDYEVLKKNEYYECCLVELNAVLDLAQRYSEEAKRLSETASEPRKSELLKLSEIMANVPRKPANTFYEAIQSVQFYLSTLFGLYPFGRPDRYLYKFYEKDIKDGTLTKEFAQELIDNFCLYVSDRVFSRAACGFIVGGRDSDGKLVENDLTYMFVTALEHIRMSDPNGALAVNEDTSDEILEYATSVLAKGTTHPAFYNDDCIINSLVENYSVKKEDAVNYIHSTCAEISVVGKSKSHTTPYSIDLTKILHLMVGKHPECKTIDEIIEWVLDDIKSTITRYQKFYGLRMLEASRIGHDPIRVSVLIDDCIEKGKDIYEGGERYTFIQPILVGFANFVDSVIALEDIVFNTKKHTLAEFDDITKKDFAGNEMLRQYIINRLPHYGNNNEYADKTAEKLIGKIMKLFEGNTLPMNKLMMPGTFTYIAHATMGKTMWASFDGRKNEYSYSDGCSPAQGRDINGPTAMISSLTSWDQSKLLGGMVVNIKFNKGNLEGDQAKNFIALLKTFIKRGGIEIQVNCVDRSTLEDAVINPEEHRDLLVRIGGYSDYFVHQNPTMQQEIIDRTQY